MIFMAMLAIVIPASAALPIDSYTIKRDKLPEAAREMLDKHFPKAKISMIRVDRHLLRKTDYDVKLTNGTKIEFDNKGNWTSIDCKKREVPTDLVNKTVKRHVTKNYSKAKIVSIRKKLSGYVIGLSDSKTLKYDLFGTFKGEVDAKEKQADPEEQTDQTEDAVPAEQAAAL